MPSNFFPWDTASITDVEHYAFLAWIEAIATVLLCWEVTDTSIIQKYVYFWRFL